MFSLSRAWMGAGLGIALLALGTGCNDTLKQQNQTLMTQNKLLTDQVAQEKQATADAQAAAKAAQDQLIALQSQPKTPVEGPGASDILPPSGPGRVGRGGPAVKPADSARIVIAGDVLFDSGKSTLKPAAKTELKKLVAQLKTASSVKVEGYTDAVPMKTGTNEQLSLNRANAVKTYLVSQGIPASHIKTAGLGATNFKDPQHPTAAVNRRVELVVAQ